MAEFLVLGPVELRVHGVAVDLGQPKQRAVFTALAVDAGRPVPVSTLIDRVWDERPPAEARNALYAHIMRIRRVLRDASKVDGCHAQLVRRGGGYALEVDPQQIDLHQMRSLVDQARNPGLGGEERAVLLRRALRLWRGTPLHGLSGSWADRVRESCRAQRVDAVVAWSRTELELGNHEAVIGHVRELLAEHPLAEPLTAALMRALFAAGRAAEALGCYAALREQLADGLGADPGAELQELHRAILRGEPSPMGAQPATSGSAAVRANHQLPPDVATFTGREDVLGALHALLPPETSGSTTAVVAIQGMGGVGKTSLAVHFAHQLVGAGRYAGLQLYVDLHGHANGPAADPSSVLASVLRLLGVPGGQIPPDLAGRAALYRDRLHDARALVLLDNAASETQVRPLLPSGRDCLVLVTSRRTLALDGAHPFRLDVFTQKESVDLLARMIGQARVVDDLHGAVALAAACGNLPLAVVLAARRLQARPTWRPADLAERLRETAPGLDALSVGDRTVDGVFELSYQALDDQQRRMFRLFSLHPGDDATAASVAALAGVPPERAITVLESLVDEHLLQQTVTGRYFPHDLLRRYSQQRCRVDETPERRAEAVRRCLGWFLAMSVAADSLVDPHRGHVAAEPGAQLEKVQPFADRAEALAWLNAERVNLTAAVTAAVAAREDSIAWRLAATMWDFLYLAHRRDECVATHQAGLAAARRSRLPDGQAWMLNNLGLAHWRDGEHERAIDCYQEALRFREELGNRRGQAVILDNLGSAYDELGRHAEAVECYQRGLALADGSNVSGQAITRHNLGETYRRMREFGKAEECLTNALAVQRDIGDDMARFTLCTLGELHDDLGERVRAAGYYRDGLDLARRSGDLWLTAVVLDKLGQALAATGDRVASQECWQESLAISTEIGDLETAKQVRRHLRGAERDSSTPVR